MAAPAPPPADQPDAPASEVQPAAGAPPAADGAPPAEDAADAADAGDAPLEDVVRAHVVANGDVYVQRLADFAAIPSCSTVFERRAACGEAAALVSRWIVALRGAVESVNVGFQELPGGVKHDLPPVLLASIGAGKPAVGEEIGVAQVDPDKPTVLVYANYDVRQVAAMSEPLPAVPGAGVKFAQAGYRGVGVRVGEAPKEGGKVGENGKAEEGGDGKGEKDGKEGVEQPKDAAAAVQERVGPNASAGSYVDERLPFWEDGEGVLHGFGLASGKAALLSWLWAVEAFQQLDVPLPVNLKLMAEGMANSNSECMSDLMKRESRRGGFLSGVDYVLTSAGLWPAARRPSLIYALRGSVSVDLQVSGGTRTLDAGEYGGVIAEPLTDVVHLLARMTAGVHAGPGGISIDGLAMDAVAPMTPGEMALASAAQADVDDVRAAAGGPPLLIGESGDAARRDVLLARTRFPAVSIHGIEGAYAGPGVSPVIPPVCSGKASVRLGPGQSAAAVSERLGAALEAWFKELQSPNELTMLHAAFDPWAADPDSPLYRAASAAVAKAVGVRPALARSGRTVPVLAELQAAAGAPGLVLPLCGPVGATPAGAAFSPDDDPLSRNDYLSGIVVLCAALHEVCALHVAEAPANAVAARKAEAPPQGAFGKIREIWNGLA